MLVIPAIDLKDGRCVRLRQGRMEDETVFSDDPVQVAQRWVDAGARRLHMVDLNGAFEGRPVNAQAIRAVAEKFPDLPIQVGGGIRDEETVQAYLDAGVQYVILGTRAVSTPHFINDLCLEFPGHIIVGLDAKNGKVAIDGWSKLSNHSVIEMAQRFEQDGVEAIVFTDIGRDGAMSGPNFDLYTQILRRYPDVRLQASGGVRDIADIERLREIGVPAAITGKALLDGKISAAEVNAFLQSA